MPEAWLTYETFAPLLGAAFTARTGEGDVVPLTLVEASDTGVAGGVGEDGRTRTQFSVVFQGPPDIPLDQGPYAMTAHHLGEQLIFLVPIRADSDGRYYEAVFA
jgi:hypothetical protein